MNKQKERFATNLKLPKFANEDAEATWWAGTEGRKFLKQQSAARPSSLEEDQLS